MNEQTLDFINHTDKDMQPLVEQLHDVLIEIEPRYHVDEGWSGLAFHRDDNISCVIRVYDDHIKLMIADGHALEDEQGALHNDEDDPYMRIDVGTEIQASLIEDVLTQQFALFDANDSDDLVEEEE